MLTVEDRYPWVPATKAANSGKKTWLLKNQVARALVDQDQLEDYQVFEDAAVESAASQPMWSHLHHSKQFFSSSNIINAEAEDLVSSPARSLIFKHGHQNPAKSTPAVDFPFQFNFGSIYSSSLTIYFDN